MNTFIITAGGIGKRMGNELPKQFLLLKGKPVLLHTLERFHDADKTAQIFITLPKDWLSHWDDLIHQYNCSIPHTIISGGKERYDSINNALKEAKGKIIAVHDGVRPLVSIETINRCIQSAEEKGSGVPCLPIKESVRKRIYGDSIAVDRKDYIIVQTPQCFSSEIIRKAYELPFHSSITDDASLVEEAGYKINLVKGNEENIKLTMPSDLLIAEFLLGDNTPKT